MFRPFPAGLFLVIFAFPLFRLAAQEGADFHQFTDKKSQTITARLLSVSPDRQQMKIRREDGQEFESGINLLSLDDQQYVKDWMKKQVPVEVAGQAVPEFRLKVTLTRQTGSVNKHTENSTVLEGRPTTFRVAIRNLSRDSLDGAKLEYALVWEDRATIYQTDKKAWTYTAVADETGSSHRVRQAGTVNLEMLRFNGEITVETVPVSMEQVFLGDNKPYRQDEMIGAKIRILSADGLVLHEADSGGPVIAAMKWDDIQALPAALVIE